MPSCLRWFALVLLGLALLSGAAPVAALGPAGDPTPIHQVPGATQEQPAVATAGDHTVVVWCQRASGDGQMYARRLNGDGAPAGEPFLVRSLRVGSVQQPDVAVGPDGSVMVAWRETGVDGRSKVMGRRYSADGSAGAAFQISGGEQTSYGYVALALQPDGTLLAVYQRENGPFGQDVLLRRFGPDGAPIGAEQLATHTILDDQRHPDIAAAPDGSFVVVWQNRDKPSNRFNVYARHFAAAAGAPLEGESVLSNQDEGWGIQPRIAVSGDGAYAVVWTAVAPSFEDTEIFVRRLNNGGIPVTWPTQVNIAAQGFQLSPTVALDSEGNLLVAWQSDDATSTPYARYYGDTGEGTGLTIPRQFALDLPANTIDKPAVVTLPGQGRLLAFWGRSNDDTVYGRHFLANLPPTIGPVDDLTLAAGASATVLFTVDDAELPTTQLAASAASSDESLLPTSGLSIVGGGASRTLTVTSAPGRSGTATVTLSVSDGVNSAVRTFRVTVSVASQPTPSPTPTPQPGTPTSIRVFLPLLRK